MSSEWSRLRSRQLPLLSAASSSARFDTLLDPGGVMLVRSRTGTGSAGRTSTAGARTRSISASGTVLARSSTVAPMRLSSTTRFCVPAFFLSTRMMSSKRAVVSCAAAGCAVMRASLSDTGSA